MITLAVRIHGDDLESMMCLLCTESRGMDLI